MVALGGRHAPPVSRDARLKAVDPLPGGLYSTPEQDALALAATDQQAQGRIEQGRLLHAAPGPKPAGATPAAAG